MRKALLTCVLMSCVGCLGLPEVKEIVNDQLAAEGKKAKTYFAAPEVKTEIIAKGRLRLSKELVQLQEQALTKYDAKAPATYDKAVEVIGETGIFGAILGVAFKVLLGAGALAVL